MHDLFAILLMFGYQSRLKVQTECKTRKNENWADIFQTFLWPIPTRTAPKKSKEALKKGVN